MHARPFKLLRSALIKLPSKQKSLIYFLSTFHRKGSTKSKQVCMHYSRFCVCT